MSNSASLSFGVKQSMRFSREFGSGSAGAVSAKCGAGYHDSFKQPKVKGVCDVCGSSDLRRRADDNAESLRQRLMEYYKKTSPLIGYYHHAGKLFSVDGLAEIDDVAKSVARVLDGAKGA